MGDRSSIEWTDATWNPVHGCSKVSPGCAHCYAETLSRRFGHTPAPWTPANAEANVQLKPERLDQPLRWRRPRMVFVNSMSDLFHEQVPDEFIARVFATMAVAPRHTFQVLTKRPARMASLLGDLDSFWPVVWGHAAAIAGERAGPAPVLLTSTGMFLTNVWLGVSIENRRFVDRADLLRLTPAAVRFISAEPLLGPLLPDRFSAVYGMTWRDRYEGPGLDLSGIDWLIAGGESGAGHRPVGEDWVRRLRDACRGLGVAFFFKQWGGRTPKDGGRELDGRTWDEMPVGRKAVVADGT